MTITAHALTATRKNAAVSATLVGHTTDPGVLAVTYPTGITGPATITVDGTRTWGNIGAGGDYVARAGSEGNDRTTVTFYLEIDVGRALAASQMASNGITTILPVWESIRADIARRVNWMLYLRSSSIGTYALGYAQSASSSSNEVFYIRTTGYTLTVGKIRFAVVLDNGTGGAGSVLIYTGARANVDSLSRAATSGTMGGTEYLVMHCAAAGTKILAAPSDAELDTWFGGGSPPAANRELCYPGGQEIVTAAPKLYDTSGNAYDLTDTDITGWQAAALQHPDYTDSGFTSPAFSIPITIAADCAAGDHTITLRRTRVGIPSRTPPLSDAELYDDASATVTVTVEAETVTVGPDVVCQVPSYPATFDLIVASNYDGDATVESDDPNIIPASPVTISGGVAVCSCLVLADVTGATITATGPGGDTDTCSVTVSEAAAPAETLAIGPDVTAVVDAYPAAIKLLVTSNNDGEVTVESDDTNLIPASPVTVASGEVECDCLVLADITGATVTASRLSGVSSTCLVQVSEVVTGLKIGPSQTVRRGSTTITVHVTGEDGSVTLASTPHGLDCPTSATISGGEVDVVIPILSAGTYTITATQGALSDTAVVIVPGNYQATEDYDLVQDVADVIEDMIPATGNAYHYDEIVIDNDGRLDAEDHVFGVRIAGTIEGPIVGGKTIMVEVAVASFPQASPAEVEALQNYISQEADWPAYVGAVVCNQVQVNALNGGDIVIYQLEVILG